VVSLLMAAIPACVPATMPAMLRAMAIGRFRIDFLLACRGEAVLIEALV
jgi:hypothetical protein